MTKLPDIFTKRMREMLGEEEFALFLSSYDKPRAQALRVNPLKISAEEFQKISPFPLRPVPWCATGFYYAAEHGPETSGVTEDEAMRLPEIPRPGRHPFHEAGLYYIQEPSAMAVAALSGTKPGEKVLDLCAAPGGKSTQLAGMLGGRGLLVTNEISAERARVLSQNIERLGVRNAIVTNETSENLARHFAAFFDRIVVDAPCSGEGMFKKEEQALTMWSKENVETCAARQQDILEQAALMLRTGGTLVYSTCTFAPEEDEESVAVFLTHHPEFSVVNMPEKLDMDALGFATGRPKWCREIVEWKDFPGDQGGAARAAGSLEIPEEVRAQLTGTIRLFPYQLQGEGHFVAVLHKDGDAVARPESVPVNKVTDKEFLQFCQETLATDIVREREEESCSRLLRFGDELYLEPYGLPLKGMKVLRPGFHLGTFKKNRFEPSHALALALSAGEVKRTFNIAADSREAAAWLRGESIPCDPAMKGWTLVTVAGYSLGWGKAAGGMMKNHYPKGLRKNY